MPDQTQAVVTWDALTTAGSASVVFGGSLVGVWWRLQQRIQAVSDALTAYKLEVAKEYASVGHLKEVEARLVVSIDRLTERIDKLIDKMDRPS